MSYINYFAKVNFRKNGRIFGIKKEDRRYHTYIIGKTGMGKTTLLLNMALNDIKHREGIGFIDPHGDAAEKLLSFIPKERIKDVIYFDPIKNPIPINPLEKVESDKRHIVASGLISTFKKIWHDFWGPRLEYILRNAILAVLEYPEPLTLQAIQEMLVNYSFQKKIVAEIRDPVVTSFWKKEYPRFFYKLGADAVTPILNKIGAFLSDPIIRNIVLKPKSQVNFREILDNQKIFIANLSKGKIGEDNTLLLGGLLLNSFYLASLSRQDIPEEKRKDFFLFSDEFHSFIPENFVSALSECRKYRLCLTLAHQYIGQLNGKLRKAIFGNVGTIIAFKVGIEDAEILEKEFYPEFRKEDLINLDKYRIYVKMVINGKTSKPFSGRTIALSL